jgi:hypothetical protein
MRRVAPIGVTIDSHPQLRRIIDAALNGLNARQIADAQWLNPPLHRATIWRYIRNKIKPTLGREVQLAKTIGFNDLQQPATLSHPVADIACDATRDSLRAGPIISRIQKRYADLDAMIDKAKETENLRDASSLIKAETSLLGLDADIAGLRSGASVTTNWQINLAVMAPAAGPAVPGVAGDASSATIEIKRR